MYNLVIKNLTKIFSPRKSWFSVSKNDTQDHYAINNISFALKQDEIVGLIGGNGAGKSTLMHMLTGVLTPSSGSINYFGKDFSKNRSALLQDIAFASSYFKPARSLTVMQNLKFFAQVYNMPKEVSDKKIDDLILAFGLVYYKDKKVSDLSAGESNKIGILKAFLPDAKIVLLDEPTAFLDMKTATLVRTLIKNQRKQFGTTFFLTSHNQQDISELCDRVLILERGHMRGRLDEDSATLTEDPLGK
jgi:ABC-2 type transport system ATP-binding protein